MVNKKATYIIGAVFALLASTFVLAQADPAAFVRLSVARSDPVGLKHIHPARRAKRGRVWGSTEIRPLHHACEAARQLQDPAP